MDRHSNTPSYVALAALTTGLVLTCLLWASVGIAHVLWSTSSPPTDNPLTYLIFLIAGKYPRPGAAALSLFGAEVSMASSVVWLFWRKWTGRFDVHRQRRVAQRRYERDQSPVWARPADVESLLYESAADLRGRILLGELIGGNGARLATPRYTSVAVVAPTGSSKTVKYVVPTILRWPDAVFVTSTKSDVVDLTIKYRHMDLNRPVYILDPGGEWPDEMKKHLCAWSPLMEVDTYADAEKVAQWLAESAGASTDPKIRFYINLTQITLTPLLWIARKTGLGMEDIVDWISNHRFAEVHELVNKYQETHHLSPDELSDCQLARRALATTINREEYLLGIIVGNADFILKPFVSARMAPTVEISFTEDGIPYSPHGRPVLDMKRVLAEGGTIYAVSDEEEQEMLRPVFVSVAQSFLRACRKLQRSEGTGPLSRPPLLLLEEAANVAPLSNLDKIVATYRGFGIVVMSIWQDEAQIGTIYESRAATVLGNHTTRVYLPGSSDDQTLDRLSRLIGDQPIASTSTASTRGRYQALPLYTSSAEGERDVRVAPIDYLRTLPQDVAVVLSGRLPPILAHSTPWYLDRYLRARVGEEACRRYDQAFGQSRPARQRRVSTADARRFI